MSKISELQHRLVNDIQVSILKAKAADDLVTSQHREQLDAIAQQLIDLRRIFEEPPGSDYHE